MKSVPFGILAYNNRPTAEENNIDNACALRGKKCGVGVLSQDLSLRHDLICLTGFHTFNN